MNTRTLFDLTGRVALVTGGNGGIGRGIALGLAEAGAAVAVFGRNDNKNRRVLDELKASGSASMAMNVDVTDRDGLEPAFHRVEHELGEVDILVNNAGHANLSSASDRTGYRSTALGKLLRHVGEPACWAIGLISHMEQETRREPACLPPGGSNRS